MPLTIETGAGVAGADSFITTAQLDTICTDYFAHTATGSTAQKEAALRRAYLFMRSLKWKADYPWPTLGGVIPQDVKNAQGIFGHYEKDNPNGLAPTIVIGQSKVLNRVGEIGYQVTGQGGIDAQRASVMMAMDLLADYIDVNGATKFLARA